MSNSATPLSEGARESTPQNSNGTTGVLSPSPSSALPSLEPSSSFPSPGRISDDRCPFCAPEYQSIGGNGDDGILRYCANGGRSPLKLGVPLHVFRCHFGVEMQRTFLLSLKPSMSWLAQKQRDELLAAQPCPYGDECHRAEDLSRGSLLTHLYRAHLHDVEQKEQFVMNKVADVLQQSLLSRKDDDGNESAFLQHLVGFLKQIQDLCTPPKGSKVPPSLVSLKGRVDELVASVMSLRNSVKPSLPAAVEASTTSEGHNSRRASLTNSSTQPIPQIDTISSAAEPSLQDLVTEAHKSEEERLALLTSLMLFLERDMPSVSAPSSSDTLKLRKLARDMTQLLLVRSTSLLSHRLPLIVELSLHHAFSQLHAHKHRNEDDDHRESMNYSPSGSLRDGAPLVSMEEGTSPLKSEDETEAEVVTAAAQEGAIVLSDSITDMVLEHELETNLASSLPASPSCSHGSLKDRLLKGVLVGERCLLKSLSLLVQSASPSAFASQDEASSTRVVARFAFDAMKQWRAIHGVATTRVVNFVRSHFPTCTFDDTTMLSSMLKECLGVDVRRVLSSFGHEVCRASCSFLVQVAAVAGTQETLPAAVWKNKSDSNALLFRLSDLLLVGAQQPIERAGFEGAEQVLEEVLPIPLFCDFLAAIAKHAGDENDGQLLSVKLLTDSIQTLSRPPKGDTITAAPQILASLMKSGKHRRSVFSGMLNCLVSIHSSVLSAGLSTLEALCLHPVGLIYGTQEIGFVYGNAVIRLLESENSPNEVKLRLINHFKSALLQKTISTSSDADTKTPLIIVLFRLLDLNLRLHQVHVVQQYIAALGRIVRTATPADFIIQKGEDGTSTANLAVAALQCLVALSDLLSSVLPHQAINVARLRNIAELREAKAEDQRSLDVINNIPVKGVAKRFNIDSATMEQRPVSKEGEAGQLDPNLEYAHIPPPPTPEVEELAKNVARFLLTTPALSPMSIGEFLSDPKTFPLQVCKYFMSALDLEGRNLTSALSEMLAVLQLPKEGQRIERLLEFFTHAYFNANVTPSSLGGAEVRRSENFPFVNVDACFIVVVATVMLNTDMHNPRISSKMNRDSFRSQLRGCNDGKDFPPGFADGIFDGIQSRPLSNVKGIGAATVSGNAHVSTALPPAGKMDMLFFSASERKELMFGMERQRLILETRELLVRRGSDEKDILDELRVEPSMQSIAIARDLLLCVWPSLCVVFGVAMSPSVTGALIGAAKGLPPQADMPLLKLCLRGLQAAFLSSTALCLSSESDVTVSTIMKMSQAASSKSVQELCLRTVLDVAASEHSANFSVACWTTIVQILIDAKKSSGTSGLAADVESVYGMLELFVARAAEVDFSRASPATSTVERVLNALVSNATQFPGDGITLGAYLYAIKRLLMYTVVVNRTKTMQVHRRIALPMFRQTLAKKWTGLLKIHAERSDECSQLLHETFAELLAESWNCYGLILSTSQDVEEDEETFVDLFRLLTKSRLRKEGTTEVASPLDVAPLQPAAMVSPKVRLHTLQAVKALMASTLNQAAAGAVSGDGPLIPLSLALKVWSTLLGTVGFAFSDAEMIGTEGCSLAVLTLRAIVSQWSGSGSTQQLPVPYRDGLGQLLAHVAYIGAMCADVNNAHSCVSQLTTLANAVLNYSSTTSGSLGAVGNSPLVSRQSTTLSEPQQKTKSSYSSLSYTLLEQVAQECLTDQHSPFELGAGGVVKCVLQRLCLLLRCEKQSVRHEAIDTMKNICALLNGQDLIQFFIVHLTNAVLEASLGHPDQNHKTSVTDPSINSFPLLGIQVSSTLKRCSRTTFSTTLPIILQVVTNDVLHAVPLCYSGLVAAMWVQRCLVALVVSPRTLSIAMRSAALRALLQCIQVAHERDAVLSNRKNAVGGVPVNRSEPIASLTSTTVINVLSFVLYSCTLLATSREQASLVAESKLSLCEDEEWETALLNSAAGRSPHHTDIAATPAEAELQKEADDFNAFQKESALRLAELQFADSAALSGLPPGPRHADSAGNISNALQGDPTNILEDRSFLQALWSLQSLLVAPFPKIIQSLFEHKKARSRSIARRGGSEEGGSGAQSLTAHTGNHDTQWAVPSSSDKILRLLLLRSINHNLSLFHHFIQGFSTGAAVSSASSPQENAQKANLSAVLSLINSSPSPAGTSSGEPTMQPHAPLRGAASAFFLLEMDRTTTYTRAKTLKLHTENLLLTLLRAIEMSNGILGNTGSGNGSGAAPAPPSNLHLLQLARSCCTGVIHETTQIVSFFVGTMAHRLEHRRDEKLAATATADEEASSKRRGTGRATEERRIALLWNCIMSDAVFEHMVNLLSPNSSNNAVIPAVKRYLLLFRTGKTTAPSTIVILEEDDEEVEEEEEEEQVEGETASKKNSFAAMGQPHLDDHHEEELDSILEVYPNRFKRRQMQRRVSELEDEPAEETEEGEEDLDDVDYVCSESTAVTGYGRPRSETSCLTRDENEEDVELSSHEEEQPEE